MIARLNFGLFAVLLLFFGGCKLKQKNESVLISEEIDRISNEFRPKDIEKLEQYSKHSDPWVRANCAGAIKFVAAECDPKSADELMRIITVLADDRDRDVARVSKDALIWIKEIRSKKIIRK